MTRRNATRQRGAALIALLAIVAMGSAWYLVSRLNTESGLAAAANKASNARTLLRAKQALVSYVAAQAAKSGENNPGALPCPEAAGNVGNPALEGQVASSCTLPKIGRFPWRTIGTEKLVDASNEPLWYVVSPGWAYTSSNLTINSDTAGQLQFDPIAVSAITRSITVATVTATAHGFKTGDIVKITGATPAGYNLSALVAVLDANQFTYVVDPALSTPASGSSIRAGIAGVALIVAPGNAMNVQATTDCTARNQARSTPSSTINPLDYIECYNTATSAFSSSGPSTSFNDQAIRITAADVMPGIEAAISDRISREIVPVLNTVYTSSTFAGISGINPVYPYASPFANPGTSTYLGSAGTYQGLLPFFQTQSCSPATDPRCNTTLLAFSKSGSDTKTAGSGTLQTQSTCAWVSTAYVCTGEYYKPSISVTVSINVTNVAMGLRTFDLSKVSFTAKDDAGGGIGTQTVPFAATSTLNSDGSATVTVAGSALPDVVASGWGTYANYVVSIDRAAFGDHALLSSTDSTTGWFVRNEWFRLLHYAVARGYTTEALAAASQKPACPTSTSVSPIYPFNSNCLTVSNVTPASSQRAILILAGRSINGSSRPSSALADYLEFGNRIGNFEKLPVAGSIANSYSDAGSPNAYAITSSIATGRPFQFKAANANTGTSTLTTATTGTQSLRNVDGSNLTAAQILLNSVNEVTYDGTQFILTKRPFNDRIIVIGSN